MWAWMVDWIGEVEGDEDGWECGTGLGWWWICGDGWGGENTIVRAMRGTWPPYHCATEPKSHRGVAAYWATTPIRVDMVRTIGPYNYPPP